MSDYHECIYLALNHQGKRQKGALKADSIRQVRQRLCDYGLIVLEVNKIKERKASAQGEKNII